MAGNDSSTSTSDIRNENESLVPSNANDEHRFSKPAFYSDENKLIEEAAHDITVLSSYFNSLLKRVRK